MTAVAFDTHKFIKELKGSGVPEGQAEALQRAFSEAIGANLATKVDIERLENKIESHRKDNKSDIERLEQKMEIMEQRITIRLGSIMVVGIAVLAGVIKFL